MVNSTDNVVLTNVYGFLVSCPDVNAQYSEPQEQRCHQERAFWHRHRGLAEGGMGGSLAHHPCGPPCSPALLAATLPRASVQLPSVPFLSLLLAPHRQSRVTSPSLAQKPWAQGHAAAHSIPSFPGLHPESPDRAGTRVLLVPSGQCRQG